MNPDRIKDQLSFRGADLYYRANNAGGDDRDTYTPPQNQDAEQALLSAILSNNKAYEAVSEFLQPGHFYNGALSSLFAAIITLIERGQTADAITLRNFVAKDDNIKQLGGAEYIAQLAGTFVALSNAKDYGRVIYDAYLRRQLIGVGESIITKAHGEDLEADALHQVEEAEQRLFQLATAGDTGGGFVTFKDSLGKAINTAEAAYKGDRPISGITTGLRDLDHKLGGLQKSDLIILAGRPSMGKTALATNIAYSAARLHADTNGNDGAVTAFFSLEMSAEQLAMRQISEHARVPSDAIRRGKVTKAQFNAMLESKGELERVPLLIDDTTGLSIAALRTRARRLKRSAQGLGLIIVDYLQLMDGSARYGRENRVQEVSHITSGLKGIAKDLDVPVIALSQLSRNVESREDKRPQLADLRDSGTIEQDADVVMFVFREEYYHERTEPVQHANASKQQFNDAYQQWEKRGQEIENLAEVIIAKQRHGPIGTVKLHFEAAFTKFSDLAIHNS